MNKDFLSEKIVVDANDYYFAFICQSSESAARFKKVFFTGKIADVIQNDNIVGIPFHSNRVH